MNGPTLGIIGDGFSAAALLIHMARQDVLKEFQVTVFGQSLNSLGRGAAYADGVDYLLNVPAGGMSLFEDDPLDFVRWLSMSRKTPQPEGEFVPRSMYGDYVSQRRREAMGKVASRTPRFSCGKAEYLGYRDGKHLVSSGGKIVRFDEVVIATGHSFQTQQRYGASADWRRPQVVVGSGLTAAEVALRLIKQGSLVQMISRHGDLPLAHRVDYNPKKPQFAVKFENFSPRALMRLLREWVFSHERDGGDWRDVIAAIRPHTPFIWRSMSVLQRAQFLRHCQHFWDLHRHRVAPHVLEELNYHRKYGKLEVIAARVVDVVQDVDQYVVTFKPRGSEETATLRVSGVQVCTGPDRQYRNTVAEQCAIDGFGLGVKVDGDYRLNLPVEFGERTPYYLGPGLRARDWEAIAVPELRVHAERLARKLGSIVKAYPDND